MMDCPLFSLALCCFLSAVLRSWNAKGGGRSSTCISSNSSKSASVLRGCCSQLTTTADLLLPLRAQASDAPFRLALARQGPCSACCVNKWCDEQCNVALAENRSKVIRRNCLKLSHRRRWITAVAAPRFASLLASRTIVDAMGSRQDSRPILVYVNVGTQRISTYR
jgi:hypothetical protein